MKVIQIILILMTAIAVFLYVTEGRLFHPAQTLPFNSRGPVELGYERAGLIVLGLLGWGLYRLWHHGDDQDR